MEKFKEFTKLKCLATKIQTSHFEFVPLDALMQSSNYNKLRSLSKIYANSLLVHVFK